MNDPTVEVQLLLTHITKAIVDDSANVQVKAQIVGNETILHLIVAPHDVGKVIGSKGQMARCLQTLVGAMSMKHAHRFSLKIVQ